jgi:prepilin-type N-terminal cleavage/methylation domain-containing protein
LEEIVVERYKFYNGFTLIEIIVALAVVGIVGVAFAGFFINSARIVSATDEREKALIIAQNKMEQLKTKEFSGIKTDIDNGNYFVSGGIYIKSFDPEEENYSGNIKIEEVNSTLFKIIIESSWNDNNSDLKIVSYISER